MESLTKNISMHSTVVASRTWRSGAHFIVPQTPPPSCYSLNQGWNETGAGPHTCNTPTTGVPLCTFPNTLIVLQAAGRLRQLMRGTQSVQFLASEEVAAKILKASSMPGSGRPAGRAAALRPHHVLSWVMSNTVQACQKGVLPWVAQVNAARNNKTYCSRKQGHCRLVLQSSLRHDQDSCNSMPMISACLMPVRNHPDRSCL